MELFRSFIHQKTPKRGAKAPVYYQRVLAGSEGLLGLYFLIHFFLFPWKLGSWEIMPLGMVAVIGVCIWLSSRGEAFWGYMLYGAVCLVWCGWYIRMVGWGCGGQHFLLPLLLLGFFNVFLPPLAKLGNFVLLFVYRMFLFSFSLYTEPLYPLERELSLILQSVNTVTLFLMMAYICVVFSSSIQRSELQLMLDNQELTREAGTDPLTGLQNRRAFKGAVESYMKGGVEESFCVAMADIDFFKKINDTYGHACGDYTLKRLADLFREKGRDRFRCGRWGGEEFCFFIPGKNLDEAGLMMNDLAIAVGEMKLHFEDREFSITVTIGVAEYDFHSTLDQLVEEADKKLYMGKNNGRNQVVV